MTSARLSLLVVGFGLSACVSFKVGAQSTPSVSGTITEGATGRRLIGVLVTLGAPPDARTTRTDESGTFAFRNLSPGTYTLSARQVGYEASTKSIQIVEHLELDFVLTRLSMLDTLRVRGGQQRIFGVVATAESLQPLANATVQVLGASTGQATTDTAGRFSYDVQTPGAYMLRAKHKGRAVATSSVTVLKESSMEIALLLDSVVPNGANALEMAYADSRERMIRRGLASAFVTRSALVATKRSSVLSALLASTASLNGLRFTDIACVFLDGVPSPGLSANTIDPMEVEAIEVYSSSGDRSGNLSKRWPRGAACGDTGYPRVSAPRSGNSRRSAPSDVAIFIVIWLRH